MLISQLIATSWENMSRYFLDKPGVYIFILILAISGQCQLLLLLLFFWPLQRPMRNFYSTTAILFRLQRTIRACVLWTPSSCVSVILLIFCILLEDEGCNFFVTRQDTAPGNTFPYLKRMAFKSRNYNYKNRTNTRENVRRIMCVRGRGEKDDMKSS